MARPFRWPAVSRAVIALHLLAGPVGACVWFAVQTLSGKDNFADQTNPLYFAALASVAFVLGMFLRWRFFAVTLGLALAVSQVASYFCYPNTARELGNLFPIAAGFLFFVTAGLSSVAAFAGWRFVRLLRNDDRSGDSE